MYDNVPMYHSNSERTRWVGGNLPVHVEKKTKSETLLRNHITEIILMKVYNMTIPAKNCRIKLKVSTYMDGMGPSFLLTLACLPMSDNVR